MDTAMKKFFAWMLLIAILAGTLPAALADGETGAMGITIEEALPEDVPQKEIAEAVDFVYDYVVSELAKLDCKL